MYIGDSFSYLILSTQILDGVFNNPKYTTFHSLRQGELFWKAEMYRITCANGILHYLCIRLGR